MLDMACAGVESAEVESADDESVLSVDISLPGDSIVSLLDTRNYVPGWEWPLRLDSLVPTEKKDNRKGYDASRLYNDL